MKNNGQAGYNLTELMIAVTLGLLLIGGVIQIFISNKQAFRIQEASARNQENGRFSIQFLTKDIRMAGFFGCGSIVTSPTNMADVNGDGIADAVADFAGNGLQGYEYTDLPIAVSDTQNLTAAEVRPGTDIIAIKRGADTGVKLKNNLDTINAQIQLEAATAAGMFTADDILFISDCLMADIFAANNVSQSGTTTTISHSTAANTGNFLSKAYQKDAQVMKMINTVYYIGTNPIGEPALFRRSMGNAGVMADEELVVGVEDMQITYGEDTDGDHAANLYVDAPAVGDMTQVVSVRIDLGIRSTEDNLTETVAHGDRRLRHTFSTTITIRNRII
jgi:type IV pilus assembly protein PilW